MAAAIDIVKEAYQAFMRNDMEGLLGQMSGDIVWHGHFLGGIPMNGTYRGKDGVKLWLGNLRESIEMLEFTPDTYLGDEETVAVTGSGRARVRQTAAEYENAWVHVYKVKDGKIVSGELFNDVQSMKTAFKL
ncbi:MAG: hypothetical protein CL946_02055 [Ectothiorhodospiraceae bacterium]|nr:hypothetical protein [Ectothiorhodospiraceae bacterium]